MSFRELRNFIEIMRNLGYSRLISMESFRNPNFVLVADILYWLVQRYDQNVDIPESISTSQDRVTFLKTVAQYVYYKARIKLNIKKLYGADGYAVKELLKLASVLNDATNLASNTKDEEDNETPQMISSKFQDNVKSIRSMSQELTESGAALYDLLEKELDLRKERQVAISQPHNIDRIKSYMMIKNQESAEMISNLMEQIENMVKDEETLKDKKKRKASDLERLKKRLSRLQSFRPGFMDEYEKKELELQYLYSQYVERHRNMEYLEHELDKFRKAEEEAIIQNQKKLENMRKKIRDEELKILRGERIIDADLNAEIDNLISQNEQEQMQIRNAQARSMRRPRAASGRRPQNKTNETALSETSDVPTATSTQQGRVVVRGSMFENVSEDEDGSDVTDEEVESTDAEVSVNNSEDEEEEEEEEEEDENSDNEF